MVENIVITKQGAESVDPVRKLFESTTDWIPSGSNLIVYKNGILQERDVDYSVISDTRIELSTAAATTDRISMVITQFLDPNGLTTIDQRITDLDRATKKIEGKAQTSIRKRDYEETVPSKFITHKDEIWASYLDPNPNVARNQGTAFLRTQFSLTQDMTVPDNKGWYATINGQMNGRIINWIPPKFGHLYHVRLYDNNGIEIPSSSDINWKWDYQAGYLFISNDHNHATPFRITGYIYTGSVGSGDLMHWKPPVFSPSLLPIHNNQDGDIRFVTSINKFYSYNASQNKWEPVDYGSAKFKDPVHEASNLPAEQNEDGDIRLVLEENSLYRWNSVINEWQEITGGISGANYYTIEEVDNLLEQRAEADHNHHNVYYTKIETDLKVRWRPSVSAEENLPPHTENLDGDIILTRDNNTVWRWYSEDPNVGQGYWAPILTANYYWLSPIDTFDNLPTQHNQPGHVRLVLDEGIAYWWDGTTWINLTANPDTHNHDDSYYTKDETYWLMPVDSFSFLPTENNKDGDVRLTLDNNNTYKWSETENKWILFSASVNWRERIDYISNLPLTENRDRDIRFVDETESFYYWDDASSTWKSMQAGEHNHDDRYFTKQEIYDFFDENTGHDHDGVNSKKIDYNNLTNIPYFHWRNPVVFQSQLPATENTIGDARIVLDEKKIYLWDGVQWTSITGAFVAHNHDDRYYTQAYIDNLISVLVAQFNAQLALKSDINHNHDARYYTQAQIDDMFNVLYGHNHDGVNSRKISYYDLKDLPDFSQTHNHDDRYYTKTQLQTPGQSLVHWYNVVDAPIMGTFKTPVATIADLPLTGNSEGDIRLVLDDSDIYEWRDGEWVYVGHWTLPGPDYWEAPVQEYINLPLSGNQNGDVRLVLTENTLYRWDSELEMWVDLSCSCEGILAADNIQVYLNGLQIKPMVEWAVSGSSLSLMTPAVAGDLISIIIITNTSIRRFNYVAVEGQVSFGLGTSYYRKDFEVTSEQSQFHLDVNYNPGQNEPIVWLNGTVQRVGDDYTEPDAGTIEFIQPCLPGDRVIVIILGYHIGVGTYIREDHVATLNQTSFTLLNAYTMGSNNLLVYLNGLLQRRELDYNEFSTTSVVFDQPLEQDDKVTFIIVEGMGSGPCGGGQDACAINLGVPTDGSWEDGLLPFHQTYKTCDAIDDINEVLLQLAPAPPMSLMNQHLMHEDLEFYSGYVSQGNINYEIIPGSYHDYLIEEGNFFLFTPDDSFSNADEGVLKLIINNAVIDTFNLYDAFVPDNSNSIQGSSYGVMSMGARGNEGVPGSNGSIRDSDLGYISIMSVGIYNNFIMWQKGKARFNIVYPLLRQGYNHIKVVHEVGTQIRQTQTIKLFFDISGSRPSLDAAPGVINTDIISSKYVSGVRYYGIGDKFQTSVIVSQGFNNTYVQSPLKIDMPGLKPLEIEYNHPDVSGVSLIPEIGEVMVLNTEFTLDEWNEYSSNAVLSAETFCPFGEGESMNSSPVNRLVNTYTNGSTDRIEYFRDEVYRLPSGDYDVVPSTRKNIWNSQNPLVNGEALLFNKKLMYPNKNFELNYKPSSPGANYTSFTGPQNYYRSFYKNTPMNSGIFVIKGITKQDLMNESILIDIKLPTQTGWLSFNKRYDETEFDGVDGDGCLFRVTGDQFDYSTGTISTANSGFLIIMRITLPDVNAPQISYIELL